LLNKRLKEHSVVGGQYTGREAGFVAVVFTHRNPMSHSYFSVKGTPNGKLGAIKQPNPTPGIALAFVKDIDMITLLEFRESNNPLAFLEVTPS
jgi:hypothetical protein